MAAAADLLQPLQIAAGIEQAVDVVDAQAVNVALADQPEGQFVDLVEDRRHLDPDARPDR